MVGATGAVVSMVTLSAARGRAGIAGGIGGSGGQAVGAVGERRGGIAPGPAAVGSGAAEQRGAVIDLDRALASAVPVSVRVLSLVMPSPTMPLSVENEAMRREQPAPWCRW